MKPKSKTYLSAVPEVKLQRGSLEKSVLESNYNAGKA